MKVGSSSLYDYLVQHPNIGASARKEVRFFDITYRRGVGWYRSYFPTSQYKRYFERKNKQPYITGEATPFYILHPYAVQRMKDVVPNIKLIVILRNPINRAYSHYQHQVRRGLEELSFEDAIKNEEERFSFLQKQFLNDEVREYNQKHIPLPYLSMGIYVKYLKNLMKYFPKEQILILKNEDMAKNSQQTLDETFNFLQVPNYKIKDLEKRRVGSYVKMNQKTREFLLNFYKPHNNELDKLLGMKFDWDN